MTESRTLPTSAVRRAALSAGLETADLETAGVTRGGVPPVRALPLHGALSTLLPQGSLRGGTVVACEGAASVSLALTVASAPSIAGSWVAVAGLPGLGLAAATEAGVVLERLVRIAAPSPVPGALRAGAPRADSVWADLLAAAVDGFEVVIVGHETAGVSPSTVRRLVARAAQRGTVFIAIGAPVFGADVRLETVAIDWRGLGEGYGIALGRHAEVCAAGRRLPGARRSRLWLPAVDGTVRHAATEATDSVGDSERLRSAG